MSKYGDFLKSAGAARGIQVKESGVLGDLGEGYKGLNEGAYNVVKGAGNSVDTFVNAVKPGNDIHPFGGTVEGINATGVLAQTAIQHPGMIKDAASYALNHKSELASAAGHYAVDQLTNPDKLAETAILAAATMGVGALGARGAAAAGEIGTVAKASRLSRFGEGAGILDKALGTGEASTVKKILHPVNTYVTQPIKDKAAQKILDVGGEAGALRQGAAVMVQGGGVKPKALSGLSDEALGAQKTMRRVKAASGRSTQFKTGTSVTNALHDPKGFALDHQDELVDFAQGHKQEALDYASSHPEQVNEAMQEVQQATSGGGNKPPPSRPVQTGGTPAEEPQPQSLSTSQFMQPQQTFQQPLQQPSNSQASSSYATGRGFQANQGMGQVSQPGQPVGRGKALLRSMASYKSQKRFYEGPNREVFRGVDPNYDWRSIEMRDNKVSAKWHSPDRVDPGIGRPVGAEPDPSNMREPIGETGPKPELSASVAEPYMSVGEQPTGALNPAVPRMIQPAKAVGSERKIAAQQNRSEFFQSGSVFDRNAALPPLSQPMARPQRQREILGV